MLRDGPGAYPVIQFNIIYIMRTKVMICGFCRPGLIMGFLLRPIMPAPAAHAAELIRFQPAISPAVFCCLVFVLLGNTMMLAHIISERQLSDRLFTCCSNACR